MKYLNYFESIHKDLKRGDIIVSELDDFDRGIYTYRFYVVLNDVPRSKRIINVFDVGKIIFDDWDTNIDYVIQHQGIYRIFKREDVRVLWKTEQDLFNNEIYESRFGEIKNIVKLVFQETGIDLKDTDSYREFLVGKTANKYNL